MILVLVFLFVPCIRVLQLDGLCTSAAAKRDEEDKFVKTMRRRLVGGVARRVRESALYKLAFPSGTSSVSSLDGERWEIMQEEKIYVMTHAIQDEIGTDDDARVLEYYVPVALWLEEQARIGKKNESQDNHAGATCVGFSIPQGGGKTTLADCMMVALKSVGLSVGVVSYDDFYLTHRDQVELSRKNPNNMYLTGRGVAGTHDVKLGADVIDNMVHARSGTVSIPRYDKSMFEGKGDRAEHKTWPAVRAPLDLVIVEGWMLGFEAVREEHESVLTEYPGMDVVNAFLGAYQAWTSRLDAALIAGVEDIEIVYKWRDEAEQARRDHGEGALSEEDVKRFCDRYMPSYRLFSPALYASGVNGVSPGRTLQFMLRHDRTPVSSACPAQMTPGL